MNPLIELVQDVKTKEALKEFLTDYINQYALDKIYKREDVSGLADAMKIIEDAFTQLEITYGLPAPKKDNTSQSR